MPVAPTPVAALSDPPNPDNRATFEALAYSFNLSQQGMVPQMNALATNVFDNAAEAATSATTATNAAASATAARDTALAAANFKGNWSDLTGALNMPACVRHNGRFWVLLANLANVAAAQPGVSASWAALDAGTVPSQLLTTAGATVNAVVGVRYLVAANNVTLVVPTGLIKGDYHGARWMTGVSGGVWNFGTTPLRGWAAGTLEIDVTRFGLDLFYEDTTRGLI
ncbi:MAG: hypothetical protein ACK40S_01660 [Burkholderiaceae bacterium]